MKAAILRQWRDRLGLSQREAADALGLSLRGYQYYEAGERDIGRHIALACSAVAFGLPPFDGQPPQKRKQ